MIFQKKIQPRQRHGSKPVRIFEWCRQNYSVSIDLFFTWFDIKVLQMFQEHDLIWFETSKTSISKKAVLYYVRAKLQTARMPNGARVKKAVVQTVKFRFVVFWNLIWSLDDKDPRMSQRERVTGTRSAGGRLGWLGWLAFRGNYPRLGNLIISGGDVCFYCSIVIFLLLLWVFAFQWSFLSVLPLL